VAAVSAAHSPKKRRDQNLHSVKPPSLHENRNRQLSFSHVADLGLRRISVVSGLALAAWGAFLRAAQDIKTNGTFNLLANGAFMLSHALSSLLPPTVTHDNAENENDDHAVCPYEPPGVKSQRAFDQN